MTRASITDPRVARRSTSYEVDAVSNPTEVFQRINRGDWEGALDAVRCNPAEARIWICRKCDDDGLVWQYLPLHLICLQRRPPFELLHALLQLYPQAASLPTPHDGNLPIHYVCESGCEDENVFTALLTSFPQSLDVKNKKDKTPLLMCYAKSRGVLMKVLRQRNPLPFKDVKQQSKREHNQQSRKRVERRDDIHTSWRETPPSIERRHTPQTVPAPNGIPDFVQKADASGGNASKTPRASNSSRDDINESWKETPPSVERRHTHQTVPERFAQVDVPDFVQKAEASDGNTSKTPRASNFSCSSKKLLENRESSSIASSSGSEVTDAAKAITNFARSAISYLYPSYEGEPSPEQDERLVQQQAETLTEMNSPQQKIIDELVKKVNELTLSMAANTDESKLCERILAKAEADNVAFRTQINSLNDEKEEIRIAADLKEMASNQLFDQIKTILSEKGSQMKINAFSDENSTCNVQIVEALQTVLSHLDNRNEILYSKIALLEADVSKGEVALKMAQSRNQLLEGENISFANRFRELELKLTMLEEDREKAQIRLRELKDQVNTLTVINQSLQEQVDSSPNCQVNQELGRLDAELAQMKKVKAETDLLQAAEIEKRTKSLIEKNQSLRETILLNNEKYSKKVQELGEKYSLLGKANLELRQRLGGDSSGEAQSHVKVWLEGDKKALLYEV
ncbi:hypothetical protein ACHAXA_001207 [Cyclostephanos tholiformis]|uniref:Uncharacterized protein n=1 Tax=Cyclostephanos tholiformis TaxID=382380 RepID=A0ABD3SQ16_9STRA